MATILTRQPNGLLCKYSTTLNGVIGYNITDEEFIKEEALNAYKTAAGIATDLTRDGLISFDSILELMRSCQPKQEVKYFMAAMTRPADEVLREKQSSVCCPFCGQVLNWGDVE